MKIYLRLIFVFFFCFPILAIEKKSSKKFPVLWKGQEASHFFKVEILAKNLGIPWGMAFLNNKELIWTEKQGEVKKIHISKGNITSISGGPKVYSKGQGGLLDIALHPYFQKNKLIYFTFTLRKKNKQTTALARGRLKENKILDLKLLFKAEPFQSSKIHFGSRIVFNEEGYLFMTVGDRGNKKLAQDIKSHLGKLLRLTDEGKFVKDNPFVKKKGAKPEIWTLGHRNPQGLFFHSKSKQIWIQEHGPRGGDEINLVQRASNYGWPVITYGRAYSGLKIGEGTHKQGMRQPIKHWTPSIAPCGFLIYSGKAFPNWSGHFFSGSLALRHLNKLDIKKEKVINENRLLSSLSLRWRHIIEGPEGFLYAGTDSGLLLRISPLKK